MQLKLKNADRVSDLRSLFDSPFWDRVRSDAKTHTAGELLTENPKTIKGEKKDYKTYVLHLSPSLSSGSQLCGGESLGCASTCLNTSGRSRIENVDRKGIHRIHRARMARTYMFNHSRGVLMSLLASEISLKSVKARLKGLTPVFRLNGTSDVLWERIPVNHLGTMYMNIFAAFPDVQFYDYTKVLSRKNIPSNYDLTYSRHETNETKILKLLSKGERVAVVFPKTPPTSWKGFEVVDGDDTDLRFLDPKGVVVGLKAKGSARKDTSGFVSHG